MSRYTAVIDATFDVQGTSGDEVVARCPWHDDKGKPNLYINAIKGVYLCHSCGAKGHLRSITEALPPLSTDDLRSRIKVMQEPAPVTRYYPEGWLKQYDFPHEAWRERGLSDETIEMFDLGWDPFEDVLTIPLRDYRRRILGVIQRRLDGERPKYKDPHNVKKGQHLFGAWRIRPRHRRVAITEGPMDAIACWDARIPAVALMGSRMTEAQKRLLQHLDVKHVVLMMDNDRAGYGWPYHRCDSWKKCSVCGRMDSKPGSEHQPAGNYQIMEMLKGTGIAVSLGEYRPYWNVKDPADLTPQRRKKMFHSAKPWLVLPIDKRV